MVKWFPLRFADLSRFALVLVAGCGLVVWASLPGCASAQSVHMHDGEAASADAMAESRTQHTATGTDELDHAEASQPVDGEESATRRDFPETLYVNHRLITDEQGRATVRIPRMADSITTWKVRAQAHTADGAFGEGEATFRVFQELFLNLQVPRTLTAGDVVDVPLTVMNYGSRSTYVEVTLQEAPWFELEGDASFRFEVEAEGTNHARATLHVRYAGKHELQVRAQGDSASDAIAVPVRVEPAGVARSRSETVRVAGARELDVPFPRLAPENATERAREHYERNANRRVVMTVQPSSYRRLLSARDALLRHPTGCFEQSLSQTLVNLEIARTYDAEEESDAHERARENLSLAYQRLLTFYDGDGRFGSFPFRRYHWDTWLNGYALYVLSGLQEFVDVDEDLLETLVERFAETLATRSDMTTTNLVGLWGIAAMHARNDAPSSLPTPVRLILERLQQTRPAYFATHDLAMLLNIFGELGEHDAYQRALDEMYGRIPLDAAGDEFRLPDLHGEWRHGRTLTGARGHAATQEVAALVLLGTTHSDDPDIDVLRTPLSSAILAQLDARGMWDSTFTTGIALRALAALERQSGDVPQGTLSGSFNGQPFRPIDLGSAFEEGRMVQLSFEAETANRLTLATDGSPVDVRIDRHMVFPDASGFPQGARAFDLRVTPGTQTLTLGESTTLKLELERKSFAARHLDPWWPGNGYEPPQAQGANQAPPQLILTVGLPGTFRVFEDALEEMVAAARIERYEISGRDVRLYLLDHGSFDAELTILPTATGTVTSPVSTVQEYYNPAGAGMAPPLSFQVTR